jgi:hypothetical protein
VFHDALIAEEVLARLQGEKIAVATRSGRHSPRSTSQQAARRQRREPTGGRAPQGRTRCFSAAPTRKSRTSARAAYGGVVPGVTARSRRRGPRHLAHAAPRRRAQRRVRDAAVGKASARALGGVGARGRYRGDLRWAPANRKRLPALIGPASRRYAVAMVEDASLPGQPCSLATARRPATPRHARGPTLILLASLPEALAAGRRSAAARAAHDPARCCRERAPRSRRATILANRQPQEGPIDRGALAGPPRRASSGCG